MNTCDGGQWFRAPEAMEPVLTVTQAGRKLTIVVPWGVPESLVEFGQVENHQQLVRFSLQGHLFSPDHRLDAERLLSHVECQLVVPRHVLLIERVVVTEEAERPNYRVCRVNFYEKKAHHGGK